MAIKYTKREEIVNSSTHALGAAMALIVGGLMLVWCYRQGDGWSQFSVWLYLFGMLSSYVASAVYHALPPYRRAKEVLRRWDHAAIYWHIAGSYSPITLIALREQGAWGWTLFVFVWTCAIMGTVMSFRGLKEHSNVETACFVLMGLSCLVALKPLLDTIPASFPWIVAEGVCYITGALFYSLHRRPYMHSVFHVFVLLGSLCHIVAVWGILLNGR